MAFPLYRIKPVAVSGQGIQCPCWGVLLSNQSWKVNPSSAYCQSWLSMPDQRSQATCRAQPTASLEQGTKAAVLSTHRHTVLELRQQPCPKRESKSHLPKYIISRHIQKSKLSSVLKNRLCQSKLVRGDCLFKCIDANMNQGYNSPHHQKKEKPQVNMIPKEIMIF